MTLEWFFFLSLSDPTCQLNDHAIHLLFSTNRWEKLPELNAVLSSGQNIILDRYAYSGASHSATKEGMSLEWCKQPDQGLPAPDMVCFLDVSPDEAAKRGGFGEEVYEKKEFQAEVRKNYDRLMDDKWTVINTDNKSIDEVFHEVKNVVLRKIHITDKTPLNKLWI